MRLKYNEITVALALMFSPMAAADSPVAPVTLAVSYTTGLEVSEYWLSEKLDGIRAFWTGKELLTRKGNPIHAPRWFTEQLPDMALDGELWAGRGNFHVVQSTVLDKTPNDKAWKNIQYMLFDLPVGIGDFSKRYYDLENIVTSLDMDHIKLVNQSRVNSETELHLELDKVAAEDGEGLMLRKVSSKYIAGRDHSLVKVKKHQDDEGVVIGYTQGKGKYSGLMGALVVQMSNGTVFKLGSGFTDELRKKPPQLGEVITFRYNGTTQSGKPKFARYMRIRVE
ncbi:DNA ligase [Vibrio sp. Of7-15]|uniref:DNA ligase n=1 Tax=Vibrio sp. Of7-15 TaxID=2724879 RepID=UPI001EF2B6AC|nr:DNA ligase [Vibrio sp. Of7-15]MCG7496441.1 DNA ligase [Vibrio sp. Of7-15]